MSAKVQIIILTAIVIAGLILVFCRMLKTKDDKNNSEIEIDISVVETQSIDDIWKIEEKENFIVAMYMHIAEKCEYGDKMTNLNEEQRVLYITQSLEMEVNNGGFSQFFFNSSGMFANELVSSFEKIGAMKTAEICKKAVSIFGDEVPVDRDERDEILTSENDEIYSSLLNECDNSFYEYEDDLVELNYQFIIKNKDLFSE